MTDATDPLLDTTVSCRECGRGETLIWGPQRNAALASRQLCFSCDHWYMHIQMDAGENKDRFVIVERTHYLMAPETGNMRGFGGRAFAIRFHDGREVVSRNLWCQGQIPAHFISRMPDNAVFA